MMFDDFKVPCRADLASKTKASSIFNHGSMCPGVRFATGAPASGPAR
jgi:hypothetical protein